LKIRRSVLYVPGNNQRALEKSRTLSADCVVYDLEDSVGPQAKDEARDQVVRALVETGASRQERIVRVNNLQSDWVEQDIAAVKRTAADAILLPKIRSAKDIQAYRKLIGDASNDGQAIWLMAETAAAVLNMSEIVAADPAVRVIMMGLEDLATETGIRYTPNRAGFMYALSASVMVARAHGVDIIDGVYISLDDEVGFTAECKQACELGFDGKSLIHPGQIDICNERFSPSSEDIRRSEEVVLAWNEERCEGQTVVVVGGRMVERLHVSEARRILARADVARAVVKGLS